MARPQGPLKVALSRGPFLNPAVPLPDSVPVVPLGNTCLMAWLLPPAMYSTPEGVRTHCLGWLKRAALGTAEST